MEGSCFNENGMESGSFPAKKVRRSTWMNNILFQLHFFNQLSRISSVSTLKKYLALQITNEVFAKIILQKERIRGWRLSQINAEEEKEKDFPRAQSKSHFADYYYFRLVHFFFVKNRIQYEPLL